MLGINSTQFLALEMNLGLTYIENFKSDSPGVCNGGPSFRGPPEVQKGSMKNLTIQDMLDINSTQFLALKMNLGLKNIKNFKSDSHGVAQGDTGIRRPP